MSPIATFSIAGYDPNRLEWGVAVQSKFLAVGAAVPWAIAGSGAVATQAHANLTYGPIGLDLMRSGKTTEETIKVLTEHDPEKNIRQVGLVDRQGNAAAHTGSDCNDWAGHIVGDGFTCQGNILLPGTIAAMANRFKEVRNGSGELADWLVESLVAGQETGGDSRGRQASAVLVVKENAGYGGNNDRYLDLRVDDDPFPIQKLKNLLEMHHIFFGETKPEDLLPMDSVVSDIQKILQITKHYPGPLNNQFDDATRKGLLTLVGIENLEERWDGDQNQIDRVVVEFLKDRFL